MFIQSKTIQKHEECNTASKIHRVHNHNPLAEYEKASALYQALDTKTSLNPTVTPQHQHLPITMVFENENLLICVTCGTQFDIPFEQAPETCRICDVSHRNSHMALILCTHRSAGSPPIRTSRRPNLVQLRPIKREAQEPVYSRLGR